MSSYQTTLPPSNAAPMPANAGIRQAENEASEVREIALIVERLRASIGSIEHSVDALEARMEPVLCPPAPSGPTTADGKSALPMTKLGQVLSEFEARVRLQANRVGDINQRTLL